jgi:hypothetical protein
MQNLLVGSLPIFAGYADYAISQRCKYWESVIV